MNPVWRAAREYAERGWSVIPTKPNKHPIGKWERWQTEIASPGQVDRWFRVLNRCVGIICGKVSGIIVVDVERHGLALYRELPMTLISMSQSGGAHWWYRYTDSRVTHTLNHAGVHVGDVRSNGQYVLAPPSQGEKGIYQWMCRESIAELPERFIAPVPAVAPPPPLYSQVVADASEYTRHYPSRSERLFALAGRVVRAGGSFEDFKILAAADWSSSKVIEKGSYGDAYLKTVFDGAIALPPGSTKVVKATLQGIRVKKKTERGDRVVLLLVTDDGTEIHQGVTLIDGSERTEAIRASLPGLKVGSRVELDVCQVNWQGSAVWRVKRFLRGE